MTKEELKTQTLYDPLTHPIWTLKSAFANALDAYENAITSLTDLELLRSYGGTFTKMDRNHLNGPRPPNCTPEIERERLLRDHAWQLHNECHKRQHLRPHDPSTHPIWNLRVALDTAYDVYQKAVSDLSNDDLYLLLKSTLKQLGRDYNDLAGHGQYLSEGQRPLPPPTLPPVLEHELNSFIGDLDEERRKRRSRSLLTDWELEELAMAELDDLPDSGE